MIFLNFKENYIKSLFIENYIKSLEFSKTNDCKIDVLKKPIILTEKNINSFINERSIVFDLYSEKYDKSIYVGESRCGLYELEALKLYILHDKESTKKRRSKEYGYGENQPIIDQIWDYDSDFQVRLLAYGEKYESESVRAFESIWNTECNNGIGCVVKQ